MSQPPVRRQGRPLAASFESVRTMAATGGVQRSVGPPPRRPSRPVGSTRTVRQRVKRVETGTVLLFSFLAYLGLFVVFQVATLVIYLIAEAAGVIHGLQHAAVAVGFQPLHHLGATVFEISFFGGLVMVVICTIMNVVLAVVYNLVSDIVGGVSLIVEERDRR